MPKKFKYDHDKLDFIEVKHSLLNIARNVMVGLIVITLFLLAYYFIFSRFFSTPQEKQLATLNTTLTTTYDQLSKRYYTLQRELNELEERDANIYRQLFETNPPDASDNKASEISSRIENENNTELTKHTKEGIDQLAALISKQTFQIQKNIAAAENVAKIECLPTMQPVLNRDLRRTAATYGMRIHPFYKVLKMHNGVDFAAPLGEKVFATGNAVVESVKDHPRTTGLTITLNHGNGYKTIYAYLFKANVKPGQKVRRGQVIGSVGNSGRSLVTHLHYEVLKDGHSVNPLHYFFQEQMPTDYEKMVSIAQNKGQSMD